MVLVVVVVVVGGRQTWCLDASCRTGQGAVDHRDTVACIKPLIIGGAALDHRNKRGETALIKAAERNNLKIGSYLLSFNANMHISNERGETPLFRAIFGGNHEFIKLLLQNGEDCTNITDYGSTVLHFIAQYGNIEIASILTSAQLRNVNPDATDFKGRTAMQVLENRVVIEEGFREAFEKLLESIKVSSPTGSGDSEIYFDALE